MFFDIEGTLKKIFRLGLGGPTVAVNEAGDVELDTGLDMSQQHLTVGAPTQDFDAVPKSYVDSEIEAIEESEGQDLENLKTELRDYTDQRIHDVQPQEGIGTIDARFAYTDFVDGYTVDIGDIPMSRLVYQIVFEVNEAFGGPIDFTVSIGTDADPEALVPAFHVDRLVNTQIIALAKSFDTNQAVKLFVAVGDEDPGTEVETGSGRVWIIIL